MVGKPALMQLGHYLGRAWFRAGIPIQLHADCTQTVFLELLQRLGRDRFELLLSAIGQSGIRNLLGPDSPVGIDFIRSVDAIKKRAQREKRFQSLESDFSAAVHDSTSVELAEAIERALTCKEAALIRATLSGQKPAEIAAEWGVAPKTISNEKTQAIRKLRAALVES